MRLLLDTHIWFWSMVEPERLSRRVAEGIEDPTAELWLSPISIWELIRLCHKGRITLHPDPASWIANAIDELSLREAALTFAIATEVQQLQLPHGDPADHFLVATAKVLDLTLVTADRRLQSLPDIQVLAND
jgi:PIN domain nuclease of toxin-antitoxin system